MAKIPTYDLTGKKGTLMTVPERLFGAKVNPALMSQAVKVYLSNQRVASARTKTRGEMKMSKAKVWRQKGTGQARHGSRNAPIFVHGAKAHGPTGSQNFNLKINRAMKQKSLFSALSAKREADQLLVIDKLATLPQKTARFGKLLKKLKLTGKPSLLVIDQSEAKLIRPTRNLPFLTTLPVKSLNTYQVLKCHFLIFTKAALKTLEGHYAR